MLIGSAEVTGAGQACDACMSHRCPLSPLRELAVGHALSRYVRGERMAAGDHGAMRLRVVLAGLAALAVGLADGRRQIVELEAAGDVFCSIEGSGEPNGAVWAEALAETLVCELDLARTSVGDGALLQGLFGLAHSKLAEALGRSVVLGRLDGGERICGYLAEMARRIGRQRCDGWHLHLPMSREDIADYLGLNAETVSRLFGRVKRAGLARFVTSTDVVIPDIGALEERTALVSSNRAMVRRARPRPALGR